MLFSKILFTLLFAATLLFANNTQIAKQLSEEIATPFFAIHTAHLKEIISSYFKANPDLKAVEIYDDMLHKTSLSCWKEGNETKFSVKDPSPKKAIESAATCSDTIKKDGKAVGKVTLFFENGLELSEEERAYIKAHPIIKVQNEEDFAPINFNVSGKPLGYSIDYIKLVAAKAGFEVKFIGGKAWFEYLEMLKENKLDAIVNIVKTEKREEYFAFTSPYSQIIDAVFAKKENKDGYSSLGNLKGKKIAIVKGFYEEELIRQYFPDIEIKTTNTVTQALKAVSFGEVDALIDSLQVGNYLIKKLAINNIEPLFEVDDQEFSAGLRIATNKNNVILRNILEKAKSKVSEEELVELSLKWFFDDGEQNNVALSSKELDYLANKKVIKMCVDPDWMPYEKLEKGKHIGLAADFIQLIEKKIGVRFIPLQSSSWRESLDQAKSRQCDIMSFLNETEDRKKFLNFTPTLYEEPEVIVADNKVPYLKGLVSLEGKTVGIVKDYMIDEYIRKNYPKIHIEHTASQNEALNLVSEGKIFASVGPLIGSAYNMNKDKLLNIKVAGTTKVKDDYRIGVRDDDPILLSILSKAVQSINEKDMIVNSWISVRYEQNIDYVLIWRILGVAVGFVIIIFIWNRTLVKQIKLKEKAQNELVQLNQTLSERVEKEVQTRVQQQDQLIQQSKMAEIGELLNVIIHQWKQPLTSINLLAQNLPDQYEFGELDKESVMDASQKIKKQVEFLVQTIDNFRKFLTPSRKESEFDALLAIEHTLSILTPQLKKYNIEVKLDGERGCNIFGLENEFKQVILNIINNTKDAVLDKKIKHPHIDISVKSAENTIHISIKDNAGGIPQNMLPDKLFQAYTSTKGEKGTGIGLSMSKTIIEQRMNGSIKASNEGAGSYFEIILPAS